MTDVWISWKDTVDPQACNTNPNDYWKVSRDPERTPFQWDNSTSGGFSTNPKTWLPVSQNYENINVAKEESHEGVVAMTHLQIFQELMRIRHENTLMHGNVITEALSQNVFVIIRTFDKSDTYITVMNIWDSKEVVDISKYIYKTAFYEVVSGNSKRYKGLVVQDAKNLVVNAKESFVVRVPIKTFNGEYLEEEISNILVKLIL